MFSKAPFNHNMCIEINKLLPYKEGFKVVLFVGVFVVISDRFAIIVTNICVRKECGFNLVQSSDG